MDELFKLNNLKKTTQRKYVLNIINKLKDDATLKNIVLNCSNKMNNSTIYRIIDLFLEKNILEKKINYNNEIYYSLKEDHSHYIICIKCHKKEKINICPIDNLEKTLQEKKGYKILTHTIELDGICKDCQNKNKRSENNG